MEKVDIILLTPKDWPVLRRLRMDSIKNDPDAFGQSYEQLEGFADEEWRSILEDPAMHMYAVKTDEAFIGLAGTRFEKSAHMRHIASIIWVYIDPTYRGKGLGRKLMEHLLSELRADPLITRVRLGVHASQHAARAMYEALGFMSEGLSKDFIKKNGVYYDSIPMSLAFADKP